MVATTAITLITLLLTLFYQLYYIYIYIGPRSETADALIEHPMFSRISKCLSFLNTHIGFILLAFLYAIFGGVIYFVYEDTFYTPTVTILDQDYGQDYLGLFFICESVNVSFLWAAFRTIESNGKKLWSTKRLAIVLIPSALFLGISLPLSLLLLSRVHKTIIIILLCVIRVLLGLNVVLLSFLLFSILKPDTPIIIYIFI